MSAQHQDCVLWYTKPANNWNEALPVGNGRLGAMFFGGCRNETIQLNEESLWAGSKSEANAMQQRITFDDNSCYLMEKWSRQLRSQKSICVVTLCVYALISRLEKYELTLWREKLPISNLAVIVENWIWQRELLR